MALTKVQTERRAELEAIVEGGMSGMMVSAYLPNYSDDAIWKLGRWAEKICDSSPMLSAWLHAVAVEEIYRRASKKPVEAKTPRLPVTWTNSELADALVDAFRLAGANDGPRELDSFFGELNFMLAVQTAERLRRTKC